MQWIDAKDLEHWADMPECEVLLPALIRRLLRATTPRSSVVNIPGGSGVNLGGWDGRVELAAATAFAPAGMSVWEMSRRSDVSTKAKEDLDKRTKAPQGVDPKASIFVFVSPRVWGTKAKFVADARSAGWNGAIAYDANDLAQWIDAVPSVGAWLAREIGKIPPQGIWSLDEFWEEWSGSTAPPISSKLVIAGRTEQAKTLASKLAGLAAHFFVKAETKDEAIAFLAAAGLLADGDWGNDLFARSVIVRSEEAWRTVSRHHSPLVLVPVFEGQFSATAAVGLGHYVVIPVGKDADARGDGIILPVLGREEFIAALRDMGITEIEARTTSRRTGRNLAVLRRRLVNRAGGPKPGWASVPRARLLVAALFAGQWTDETDGDRQFMEGMSGKPYAELEAEYAGLLNEPDSPLKKIGTRWKMTSHEEAWELLAPYLTDADLRRFEAAATHLLSTPSPEFDLPPNERYRAAVSGHVLPHSGILLAGVSRCVALMGTRPEAATAATETWTTSQQMVRNVLSKIGDWRILATLGSDLCPLAEAAPEPFLDNIEEAFSQSPNPYHELFRQSGDGMFGGFPHAGLLWALERLAWSADHFTRVGLILAQLASLQPHSRNGNRADGSLRDQFLGWIRYSAASDETRLRALDQILEAFPAEGWKLLLGIAPKTHDTANGRTPPEWREWAQDIQQAPTDAELLSYVDAVISRILAHVGEDPERWADVLDIVSAFGPDRRALAIAAIKAAAPRMKDHPGRLELWQRLRKLLAHHRSVADADWALPPEILDELDAIYEGFTPDDPVQAYAWLFESYPRLPSGDRFHKNEAEFTAQRERGLKAILAAKGVPGIFDLLEAAEDPYPVGWTTAQVVKNRDELVGLANPYLGSEERGRYWFARAIYASLFESGRWLGVRPLIDKLKASGGSPQQIAQIYLSADVEPTTWGELETNETAETQTAYWASLENVYRIRDKDPEKLTYAITKLLDADRPLEIIDLLSHHGTAIPGPLLIRTLEQTPLAIARAVERKQRVVDAYEISRFFERLDRDHSIPREVVARLEIPFVGILEHYRPTLALHEQVISNPVTFADLISWAYKRSDGQVDAEATTAEEKSNRARIAWEILHHVRRLPGQDAHSVDEAALLSWITEARRVCAERGRGPIGDYVIGQMLASAPSGLDQAWPCEPVRTALDRFRSRDMGRGFEIGKFNLRGVTSRSPFAGGDQERALAAHFRKDAEFVSVKWPFTARLLRSLSKTYEHHGRREDDSGQWRDLSE